MATKARRIFSALNRTIAACAARGGGTVRIPLGKYLSGTVRLKSTVNLQLDSGAELIGVADLDQYHYFTPHPNTRSS